MAFSTPLRCCWFFPIVGLFVIFLFVVNDLRSCRWHCHEFNGNHFHYLVCIYCFRMFWTLSSFKDPNVLCFSFQHVQFTILFAANDSNSDCVGRSTCTQHFIWMSISVLHNYGNCVDCCVRLRINGMGLQLLSAQIPMRSDGLHVVVPYPCFVYLKGWLMRVGRLQRATLRYNCNRRGCSCRSICHHATKVGVRLNIWVPIALMFKNIMVDLANSVCLYW